MSKNMLRALALVTGLSAAGVTLAEEAPSGWRPFLVGGLTKGGDVLFTAETVGTGRISHVYAGNLLQIGVGGLWMGKNLPLAVGLSANYHIDDTTGASSSAQFIRMPLEAIGYYLSEDREWRVGFGLRYVLNPKLKSNMTSDGSAAAGETLLVRYKNTVGLVAETGWAFGQNTWVNFRVVKEQYEMKSYWEDGVDFTPFLTDYDKQPVNGSHIGVNLLYAF